MSLQLWIHFKDCFAMSHNKRGEERHGNYINGFSEEKNNFGQFGHFGPKSCILITLDLLQVFLNFAQ